MKPNHTNDGLSFYFSILVYFLYFFPYYIVKLCICNYSITISLANRVLLGLSLPAFPSILPSIIVVARAFLYLIKCLIRPFLLFLNVFPYKRLRACLTISLVVSHPFCPYDSQSSSPAPQFKGFNLGFRTAP